MKRQTLSASFWMLLGAGVFVAVFPWVFGYQGAFFGFGFSVRSVGKVTGGVFVVLGAWAFARNSLPRWFVEAGASLDSFSEKKTRLFVILCSVLFIFGAVSHKLKAHQMLSTHAFDLGFFSNICWNTSQGNWFFSSLLERNFMGVHVNWILWPLAWVYNLWPDARVLLIAQAVFMGAAIPVFVILVRRLTGSAALSFLAGLLFSCSPFFLHSLFNDFHPDTWQLPMLMGALWAFHARRPVVLLLLCLAAVLAKEDVSVVLSGFGIFLLCHRSWRMAGAMLLVMAIGLFFFHTSYFTPRYLDGPHQSLLFSRYDLGNSFSEILVNLVTKPSLALNVFFHEPSKFWRFLNYFFPAAGLTFLSPLYTLPCLFSVAPHLLAKASTQLSLADIYAIPSQPFVFVGAIVGLKKILNKDWLSRNGHRAVGIALVVAGAGILNAPRTFRTLSSARLDSFQKLKALIPVEASVAAQQNLLPHFDTRRFIQLFPIETSMTELQNKVLSNPDYAVCDRVGNALPFNEIKLAAAIENMEKNTAYEKIFEENNFVVFRRLVAEPPTWQ